jgi:hypothetical protein
MSGRYLIYFKQMNHNYSYMNCMCRLAIEVAVKKDVQVIYCDCEKDAVLGIHSTVLS